MTFFLITFIAAWIVFAYREWHHVRVVRRLYDAEAEGWLPQQSDEHISPLSLKERRGFCD